MTEGARRSMGKGCNKKAGEQGATKGTGGYQRVLGMAYEATWPKVAARRDDKIPGEPSAGSTQPRKKAYNRQDKIRRWCYHSMKRYEEDGVKEHCNKGHLECPYWHWQDARQEEKDKGILK